jgi:hypothetical protein
MVIIYAMTNTQRSLLIIALFMAFCDAECPRERRGWQTLSPGERDLFFGALQTAYDTGLLKTYAEIHFQNFSPNHNEAPFFLV